MSKGWLEDESKVRRFFKWIVVVIVAIILAALFPIMILFENAFSPRKRPKHFADKYFKNKIR